MRKLVDVTNERRTYSATVDEILSFLNGWGSEEEVIYLYDVRDIHDHKVAEEASVNKTKAMANIEGIEEGCLIEFEARMKTTWSGENRVSYKFLRPTKVRVIQKNVIHKGKVQDKPQ